MQSLQSLDLFNNSFVSGCLAARESLTQPSISVVECFCYDGARHKIKTERNVLLSRQPVHLQIFQQFVITNSRQIVCVVAVGISWSKFQYLQHRISSNFLLYQTIKYLLQSHKEFTIIFLNKRMMFVLLHRHVNIGKYGKIHTRKCRHVQNQNLYSSTLFFIFIRILFFRPRLNILTFLPFLG